MALRSRWKAWCGIVGPAAFTAAWAWSTICQDERYSIRNEHLSGLAAPDAHHPHVMIGGFLVLGACTTAFAGALDEALGSRDEAGAGPVLVRAAGLATVAAGLLRRDRMLLGLPEGVERQSWRNDGHDVASGVIYASLGVAPLALARRFARDERWRPLVAPAIAQAATSAALMALFASKRVEAWNGIVQRAAVVVSTGAMAALAMRVLREG